jgi:ferritin-like protein
LKQAGRANGVTASSAGLHEAESRLRPETIDRHRAIVSLIEELEAVDWYDQRVDAAGDDDLRGVLAHNRDEEKEHACMALEWLRRHDAVLDRFLRLYLFTDAPVVDVAEEAEGAGQRSDGTLAVGPLRGRS